MLETIYGEVKNRMRKTIDLLSQELARIRTARANPAILDGVKVAYYDSHVPLKQLASISVPEPRLLVIQPWDRQALGDIEKAIYKADLGLAPVSDGTVIRIPIPALTEERRKDLVKLCSKLAEDAKVAIRNIRRDANEEIKKAEKSKKISEDDAKLGQKKTQEFTDENIKLLDDLFKKKEKEILET
jgi:ribosome recycling factor